VPYVSVPCTRVLVEEWEKRTGDDWDALSVADASKGDKTALGTAAYTGWYFAESAMNA
jgi:hypothetical protein